MVHILLIGFLQRARLDGVLDGENGVALVDLGVVDDAHHGFELAVWNIKDAAHVIFDVVAGDGMRRKSGGTGDDGNGRDVYPVRRSGCRGYARGCGQRLFTCMAYAESCS